MMDSVANLLSTSIQIRTGVELPPVPVASPRSSPMRTPVVSKARAAPVGIRGIIWEGTPKSRPVIVGTVKVGRGVIGLRVVGRWRRHGRFNVGARRVRIFMGCSLAIRRVKDTQQHERLMNESSGRPGRKSKVFSRSSELGSYLPRSAVAPPRSGPQAREIVGEPTRWTKSTAARNAQSRPVNPVSPEATCCGFGALKCALHERGPSDRWLGEVFDAGTPAHLLRARAHASKGMIVQIGDHAALSCGPSGAALTLGEVPTSCWPSLPACASAGRTLWPAGYWVASPGNVIGWAESNVVCVPRIIPKRQWRTWRRPE